MRAAAGIFFGILTALSPGWVSVGLAAAGVVFFLFRTADPRDRRFLATLFLTAFIARALLSLALDLGSCVVERERPFRRGSAQGWDLGVSDKTRHYLRIGDSDYYSDRGTALAEYVRGSRESVVIFRLNQYSWNGYVDFIGLFYVLFGFSPSAVKGINCLLGAGLVLLVFFLAMRIFNRKVARQAAWGVALFPSLMFWSASNLKDTPFIFLTLLAILTFIRRIEAKGIRPKIFYSLALGLLLLLHASLRDLFYLLLLAALIAAAALPRLRIRGEILALGLAGLGIGFLYFQPAGAAVRQVLGQLFHKHVGYAVTDGASYLLFPDSFYAYGYLWKWVESGTLNLTIVTALLKAPLYFFLEPLPGRFDALYHLPAVFQMILWYGILLLAVAGIFTSLRQRRHETSFLLFPLLLFSFVMALTSGNVWTLFRIRDLVTPFLIIYAAAGAEPFFRPEAVRGSRVAAWVLSAPKFLAPTRAWMENLQDRTCRFSAGFFASPVRNTGGVLIVAVLANTLLLVLKNTEWTVWSVGFRIGLLGLGLWALAIQLDWKQLRETSLLRTFLVS